MSETNKARPIQWHETFKCKYRLHASVFNSKQRWNKDKCRCECKELIDKGVFDKGFIWNSSNCECEFDKSCDNCEYLDYENYKWRKKLVHKLVAEYTKNVEEVNLAKITLTLFRSFSELLTDGWGYKDAPCLKSVTYTLHWWNLPQLYLT